MAKLMAGLSQLNLLQPVKAVVNTVKLKKKSLNHPGQHLNLWIHDMQLNLWIHDMHFTSCTS